MTSYFQSLLQIFQSFMEFIACILNLLKILTYIFMEVYCSYTINYISNHLGIVDYQIYSSKNWYKVSTVNLKWLLFLTLSNNNSFVSNNFCIFKRQILSYLYLVNFTSLNIELHVICTPIKLNYIFKHGPNTSINKLVPFQLILYT